MRIESDIFIGDFLEKEENEELSKMDEIEYKRWIRRQNLFSRMEGVIDNQIITDEEKLPRECQQVHRIVSNIPEELKIPPETLEKHLEIAKQLRNYINECLAIQQGEMGIGV